MFPLLTELIVAGITLGVGSHWHMDGSFMYAPFSHAIYHMYHVPKSGDTQFAALTELIERLEPAKLARWERMWTVNVSPDAAVHPLIYSHPLTKKKVKY